MEIDGETHTLVIEKCVPSTAGLFTARAQNPSGQLSCNGRLKVIREYLDNLMQMKKITAFYVKNLHFIVQN